MWEAVDAIVLLVSGCTRVSRACPCATENKSVSQGALISHLPYPVLCGYSTACGLPAIYVKRKRDDTYFCLKDLYWCGIVGPSNSFEMMIFDFV
jgi:hypothetical protein